MADAVTTNVISESPTHYLVHLTNISDGTGESAVTKVDKSTLVASDGSEPASLDIEEVQWSIGGFSSVRILWDHTTDDVGLALSGSGYKNFMGVNENRAPKGLADPRSSGDTGDIKLTTAGAISGATYDITLLLRKTPD
jgi:hypothetical protein